MCNAPIPIKIFTIEIYPNGKTVLPSFITPDGMHLSISELKQCRELIDLIIDNPNYFHVVKPETAKNVLSFTPEQEKDLGSQIFFFCSECKKQLRGIVEQEKYLCFDCERKQIIQAADSLKPVEITAMYCQHSGCFELALNDVNYCLKHDLKGPISLEGRNFVCDQCGENFDTKRQLQSHQVKNCPNPSI